MNRIVRFAAILIASLGLCSLASADTLTWDFSSPTGPLANSQTYSSTPGSIVMTAYGFTTTTAAGASTLGKTGTADLYGKHDGGDENGLGTKVEVDHEINVTHFVELDLSNLVGDKVTFFINSLTGPDAYSVYDGSSKSGTLSLIAPSGRQTQSFDMGLITSSDDFVAFVATDGNMLIASASAVTT